MANKVKKDKLRIDDKNSNVFLSIIKNNIFFILAIILILVINFVKIPYEVEMPGGVINLSDRIKVDGKTLDVSGSFNMAYVEVAQGSILYYLLAHIIPDWEIVKTSDIVYSENESIEDANKRDLIMLEQSKDEATLAALEASDVPYEIVKTLNNVIYIDEKADTNLEIGDNIVEVDGERVNSIDEVIAIIKQKQVKDKVNFKVLRNNKEVDATAVLYEEDGPKVGIVTVNTYDIKSEKNITITSSASESGPSGGMMMALMIYDGLTGKDLTKGRKIVGTGTIAKNGDVGDIGGVKFKLMGAAKAKADVFLVPEGNYEEAMKVAKEKKYKINIVKVTKLQDAIDYLEGE